MWSALPTTARDFLAEHEVPVHVANVNGDPRGAADYDHAARRVIVTGVAENDGDILFVENTKPGRGWELPGGRVDDGESPRVALNREMTEETGHLVEDATPVAALLWAFPDTAVTQIVFSVTLGDEVHDPVDEISEVDWCSNIPDDVSFGTVGESAYDLVFDELDNKDGDGEFLAALADKAHVSFPTDEFMERPSFEQPSKRSMAVGVAAMGAVAIGAIYRKIIGDEDEATES